MSQGFRSNRSSGPPRRPFESGNFTHECPAARGVLCFIRLNRPRNSQANLRAAANVIGWREFSAKEESLMREKDPCKYCRRGKSKHGPTRRLHPDAFKLAPYARRLLADCGKHEPHVKMRQSQTAHEVVPAHQGV